MLSLIKQFKLYSFIFFIFFIFFISSDYFTPTVYADSFDPASSNMVQQPPPSRNYAIFFFVAGGLLVVGLLYMVSSGEYISPSVIAPQVLPAVVEIAPQVLPAVVEIAPQVLPAVVEIAPQVLPAVVEVTVRVSSENFVTMPLEDYLYALHVDLARYQAGRYIWSQLGFPF